MVAPEEHYMVASVHKALDHKREARPLLGILSVTTYLKNRRPDIVIKFIDCRAEELSFEDVSSKVKEFQPDLVGLTCLTFNYYDTLRVARLVKSIRPETKVCIGGWHVTLYPKETLSQNAVDFVVIGEGEKTFLELVNALSAHKIPNDVHGLAYKSDGELFVNTEQLKEGVIGTANFTGMVTPIIPISKEVDTVSSFVTINDSRPLDKKLDEIDFPDFNLVNIGKYSHILDSDFNITIPIESSRGCPFACTFCDIRRTRFRYRSPELIVDELERWSKAGINSFFFVDDNITVNKQRAIILFDEIYKRNLNIEFKVSSRVDRLDDEVMESMKRAGVSRVSVGIESSKQKYLDYMQKEITVEQIEDCLARANKTQLPVFAFMMIGLPGQTKEEMFDELKFLKRNKVDYASFSIMTVYPKTELHKICLDNGDIEIDPWQAFAENPVPEIQAPYVNGNYSPEQLKNIQLELTRKFYFSPRILYKRVCEVNSLKAFVSRAKLALRFLGIDSIKRKII